MIYFLSLLFLTVSWAQVNLPELSSPVVDEAGLLSSGDQAEISQWLHQYRKNGKAQIQVAIVDDLQGLPIEQYSIQLVEKWKLGSGAKDDGVLFLISAGDRKMRIEVGQGLEGALTDIQSKRILDDRVRPLFKSQQYGAGIAAGVAEIIAAVDPEFAGHSEPPAWQGKSRGTSLYLILFLLFIFLNLFGRGRGRRSGLGGFLAGAALGSLSRGGFGGRGGGGWSGGGGGFSGGGASSNW